MSRKQRSVAIVAALLVARSAWGAFTPDFQIRPDDYTVMLVCDAVRSPELKAVNEGGHGKFYVRDWKRADQFASWEMTAPAEDRYAVNVLLRRCTGGAMKLEVAAGNQRVAGLLPLSAGGWQRQVLEGTLRLPKGRTKIALRLRNAEEKKPFEAEVLSVELVRPAVRDRLHQAALAMRADTRELQKAKYGFMFHWTSTIYPRHGEQKPYAEAVRDFDVEAFAEQVKAGGAGFVVLTTSHAYQYIPAPIQSLEKLLPGRTSQRDLIGELADALGKRGIRLWLYYHIGASSDSEWMKASSFWETNTTRLFNNWCNIVSEIGNRYGDKLAGWWFDDGTINYYYRSAPWERLAKVAKAGNSRRLVAFNPWELPLATEFQDYFCGEGFGDPSVGGALAVGGDGHFASGPYEGLQACATLIMEGDWGHWVKDAEIGKPKMTGPQMAKYLREFVSRRNVPIFNMEIYQDGKLSPASVEMFNEAKTLLDVSRDK